MLKPLIHSSIQTIIERALCSIGIMLVSVGCASNPTQPSATEYHQPDPMEGFNRSMYEFNSGLDRYLLKPVADAYTFITPDLMETGVSNFFNNLKGISVVLNDVLQGKLSQGAADAGRFLTNTTVGLGGLFDVASEFGLQQNVEDFGQTLAVWGVGPGPYLVLPVMGPTTLRDGSGSIIDRAANPGTYLPGTGVLEGINERANADAALNFINEAALDPYIFTRESFLQYRRHLINDGKVDHNDYDLDFELENDSAVESDFATQSQAKIAENSSTQAFDDMLDAFEEATNKMDAWQAKSRL